jgi:methylated-DNA-[protein]-cysteine S-methyltransferase
VQFTLFDTPIGTCGVVWNERGLTGVHLPDTNPARTRAA